MGLPNLYLEYFDSEYHCFGLASPLALALVEIGYLTSFLQIIKKKIFNLNFSVQFTHIIEKVFIEISKKYECFFF